MVQSRLIFVDTVGGGLSSMAAAIARLLGRTDAAAATSAPAAAIPPEVPLALAEIGLTPVPVAMLDKKDREGESIQVVDASWGVRLHDGPGEFERIATARIARDRIERRLEQMLAKP